MWKHSDIYSTASKPSLSLMEATQWVHEIAGTCAGCRVARSFFFEKSNDLFPVFVCSGEGGEGFL